MEYSSMTKKELEKLYSELSIKYNEIKSLGLKLDMSRGKPGAEQLALTQDMLKVISEPEDCITENKLDCRNYGLLDGIPEVKRMFSELLDIPADNIIVCGNSSLNIMFDAISRAMQFGVAGGTKPWSAEGKIKFLCPVPGYDRHFAICELFGIEMINVPMTPTGPDMDMIEQLVSEDASIKGIWCVPKYSNPDGIVYSDETVTRFAKLKPKADNFRIFWDDAYAVHDLYDDKCELLNIFEESKKYGNENNVFIFASTSKISFPGSGIAMIAASDDNIRQIKAIMSIQTIGYDKLNQIRHVKFFGSAEGVRRHMEKHAEIIRPKFGIIYEALERELSGCGIAEWTTPRGGYFFSLNVMEGCAAKVYLLAKEAGVTLTAAGASFPYGVDPKDSNLRIAPTFPPLDELKQAAEVLCLCVKLASVEKLLNE